MRRLFFVGSGQRKTGEIVIVKEIDIWVEGGENVITIKSLIKILIRRVRRCDVHPLPF